MVRDEFPLAFIHLTRKVAFSAIRLYAISGGNFVLTLVVSVMGTIPVVTNAVSKGNVHGGIHLTSQKVGAKWSIPVELDSELFGHLCGEQRVIPATIWTL